MRRALLILTTMLLVGAGCGDSGDSTTTTSLPTGVTSSTAPDTTTSSGAPVTTATTPSTTSTPTTAPQASGELSGDGLDVAVFGDDGESAVAAINAAVGPPFSDDGWIDAIDVACRGTVVRFPQWDGLFVILTDAATDYAAEGTAHFAFWGAFPGSPFATPSGFIPGETTLGEVNAAIGPVTPEFNDLFDLWTFTPDSGPEAGIEFEIEDPDDPAAVIIGMSSGARDICGE